MSKKRKNQLARLLAVTGRKLAYGPLRQVVLWLWQKTAHHFLDE